MQPSMPYHRTQIYEFQIREALTDDEGAWFSPLTLTHTPPGVTHLRCQVRDQAELHGILLRIRNLNLTLLAVNPCQTE